jgi:hypothetical protein
MHMIAIIVNRITRMVPCYTCLDQSDTPDAAAALAQSNTPDHLETAHRLYLITKHQHTII